MRSITSRSWILGSFQKDFLFFYLPGLLTAVLLLSFSLPGNEVTFLILAFVCFGFFDSGHVYTSVWRTYLDPVEFSRRRKTYILSPVLIFISFFCLSFYNFYLLGALVAYATIYHNLRQFYGMSKWYQKINKSFDKVSDFFLYTLCLLSFVGGHFRTDLNISEYYSGSNIFLKSDGKLASIFVFIFYLFLLAWCLYEFFKSYKTKRVEWARVFSVALPVFLYSVSFLKLNSMAAIVFPLVVSHGLSYMVLIYYSEKKLRLSEVLSPRLPLWIGFVAVIFGGIEFYFDDYGLELRNEYLKASVAALMLTPLFCHYYFDAFLWKSSHPDFHKILS